MIYVKSLLAGFLAVVAASVALLAVGIIGILVYSAIHSSPDATSVGWDPISLWRQGHLVWLMAFVLAFFCAGFFWEYRRLAK